MSGLDERQRYIQCYVKATKVAFLNLTGFQGPKVHHLNLYPLSDVHDCRDQVWIISVI